MSDQEVSGSEGEEEEYIVEKVVDKRIKHGVVQYFLKWKNYPESENSWEPAENLQCAELIAVFERKLKQLNKAKPRGRAGSTTSTSSTSPAPAAAASSKKSKPVQVDEKKKKTRVDESAAYDGFEGEKVLGATNQDGEIQFLMKWKDCDEATMVPRHIANVRWPQVVIAFYESRLDWPKLPKTGPVLGDMTADGMDQ